MWLRSTPGPGGFGPSPAFGRAPVGVHLEPARTRPLHGVYSGPSLAGNHFWWWAALLVAVAVIAATTIIVRRRR